MQLACSPSALLHFPFARPWPKGSGVSCHLSFVLAAVAARPPVLSKTEGNAWGRGQSLELCVARGCGMEVGQLPSPELGILHQPPWLSVWMAPLSYGGAC